MVESCKGLHLMGLQPMDSICMLLTVTRPPLQAKLKSNENGHALEAASDILSCFAAVVLCSRFIWVTFQWPKEGLNCESLAYEVVT